MKGICFKEPLFHATIEGGKTQTRRVWSNFQNTTTTSNNHTCADCVMYATEDFFDEPCSPFCLAKDLYTFAYAEDPACEDFIEKQNDEKS